MSDFSNGIAYNLELSREMYTEAERKKFYDDYRKALREREEACQASFDHLETNSVQWYQFWKSPSESWLAQSIRLTEKHIECVKKLRLLSAEHPLLVQILSDAGHAV